MKAVPRALLFGVLAIACEAISCRSAAAHGGGLNAEGCHHDRKNGGYHCHRGSASSPPNPDYAPARVSNQLSANDRGNNTYFANCSAARAAGAAPVRRGDPGYASHLDRDGDGVGCE